MAKLPHSPTLARKHTLGKYLMSPMEYFYQLQGQGNKCAICGDKPKGFKSFPVDHDHETNRVRGIICQSCNLGLGHFKSSIDRLRSAIEYLERYNKRFPV